MQIKKIVIWFETVTDDVEWNGTRGLQISWNEKDCNHWKPSSVLFKIGTVIWYWPYADDRVFRSDNAMEMEKLLEELQQEFDMQVAKEPETAEGLKITQGLYAQMILERLGMVESKSVKIPMVKQDDIQEGDLQE